MLLNFEIKPSQMNPLEPVQLHSNPLQKTKHVDWTLSQRYQMDSLMMVHWWQSFNHGKAHDALSAQFSYDQQSESHCWGGIWLSKGGVQSAASQRIRTKWWKARQKESIGISVERWCAVVVAIHHRILRQWHFLTISIGQQFGGGWEWKGNLLPRCAHGPMTRKVCR